MQQQKRRLFDHVVLHVKDIEQSKKFYQSIVETLGHTITRESHEGFFIEELEVRQNPETTKSLHLAFYAENPWSVKMFHDMALLSGGKSVEIPTELGGMYMTNVMDPDGNYIEAIFKGNQKHISISN
jgi:predicted lactoylglutathione lyase